MARRRKKKSQKNDKKLETSKKLVWLSSICFIATLVFSMVMFACCTIQDKVCDLTLLVTMITVAGAVFGTACAFYYTKSRSENLFKIKRSFLKIKYLILKNIDSLSEDRVQLEIENELSKIDADFDIEEEKAKEEITYNG